MKSGVWAHRLVQIGKPNLSFRISGEKDRPAEVVLFDQSGHFKLLGNVVVCSGVNPD
jgi:hypothetical protein